MNQPLRLLALGLLACCAASSVAQGLPKKQPSLLNIVRERIKTGRADDHARNETEWVAANEKAKFPAHYLALSSMTGPNEVWYMIPAESHAEMAKQMEAERSNSTLSAEVARLTRADAEFIEDTRNIHAAARPELSYGDFPDISKARFFEIGLLQVRPGFAPQVEAVAKAYAAARKKAGAKTGYRVYSIIAGLPMPTYLIVTSFDNFGQIDNAFQDHLAAVAAMSDDEKAQFQKAWADGVILDENNRFRLDPKQSYVGQEVRASDPAFWNAK